MKLSTIPGESIAIVTICHQMNSDGSFYRILIEPIKRSSIVLGQLLEAVLCTFLEVGIMGCVSLVFHVRLATGITGFF